MAAEIPAKEGWGRGGRRTGGRRQGRRCCQRRGRRDDVVRGCRLRRARGAPTEGRLRAKCRSRGSAGDPAGTSARRELSLWPKGLTFSRGRKDSVARGCRRGATAEDPAGASARRELSLRPKGLTHSRRVPGGGGFYAERSGWTGRLLRVEGLAAARA